MKKVSLVAVIGLALAGPGRTAPVFQSAVPFTRVVIDATSPADPWLKAVGDINGDGQPDVVVGSGRPGTLVWYSWPNWTETVIATGGYSSDSGSAVGDIDGDGDLDVVAGPVWFRNPMPAGNPAAGPWVGQSMGSSGAHDVDLGDLDRDGMLDVVARGHSPSPVAIFRQSSPTSWTTRSIATPAGEGVTLADVDLDGDLDIVVNGVWYENSGDVMGGPWTSHTFAPAAWTETFVDVRVGDLNADGRPDIVMVPSETGYRASWFEGPASPRTSGPWVEHVIDAGPLNKTHSVEIADIDLDGRVDLVASEYEGARRLLVYRNGGGAVPTWTPQVVGTTGLHNVVIADVGRDGDIDIIGVHAWGVVPVELWENQLRSAPAPYKILSFSKTNGFRHSSIPFANSAMQALGAANRFTVDLTEDSTQFNDLNLAQYRAVVFNNTAGDVLDAAQEAAFQRYIRAGGGFVGIHNAANTETAWPWYGQLVGAFYMTEINDQAMRLQVLSGSHPSTLGLPSLWTRFDEAYNFNVNPRTNGAIVLVNLDETSVTGGAMGADHPYSWYHAFDGGRAWYCVGGAQDASFSETYFRSHLLGGIQYAAGLSSAPSLPSVTVTATDANAGETAPNPGTFTVTRTGSTASALTVNYALSGTAGSGDYAALPGSVTIAASSSTATVTVMPADDTAVEPAETAILTVTSGTGYAVGTPASATVTIADNDTAANTVTVQATDASASEAGPATGTFTLSRSGSTASALTVNFTVTGSASSGPDYAAIGTSVTIGTGSASATVTVTPVDDSAVESNETVILTVTSGTGYTVGTPASATVTIADNDASPDADADGLPDAWELQYWTSINAQGGTGDPDLDNLTNAQEYAQGTDPTNPDSDADGMADGWEVQYGFNPASAADGSQDADGDGFSNSQEFQGGSNPNDPLSVPAQASGSGGGGCGATGLEPLLLGLLLALPRRRR